MADTIPSQQLDNDTEQWGASGPFKAWEHDHTALVHVLWSMRYAGLNLEEDADEIASRIMHSRWLAAQRMQRDQTSEAREGQPRR